MNPEAFSIYFNSIEPFNTLLLAVNVVYNAKGRTLYGQPNEEQIYIVIANVVVVIVTVAAITKIAVSTMCCLSIRFRVPHLKENRNGSILSRAVSIGWR